MCSSLLVFVCVIILKMITRERVEDNILYFGIEILVLILSLWLREVMHIFIYIYVCVCVCVLWKYIEVTKQFLG